MYKELAKEVHLEEVYCLQPPCFLTVFAAKCKYLSELLLCSYGVLEKVQQMGCAFLCVMIIGIAVTHKCLWRKNRSVFLDSLKEMMRIWKKQQLTLLSKKGPCPMYC